MSTSQVPAFRKVFRIPKPLRLFIWPFVACVGVFIMIWIASPRADPLVFFALAILMLLGLAIGLWIVYSLRLEVTDTSIVFHNWGYRVESRWENLLGHRRQPIGLQFVETLVLASAGTSYYPVMRRLLWLARFRVLRGGLHSLGRAEPDQVGIPVGLFAENWQTGELGDIIGRYAPKAYATRLD